MEMLRSALSRDWHATHLPRSSANERSSGRAQTALPVHDSQRVIRRESVQAPGKHELDQQVDTDDDHLRLDCSRGENIQKSNKVS